jgi:predicted cupin superfamily sugar epimerase
MHPRAAELVAARGLAPHPEGGYFREIHRASTSVATRDGRGDRAALTVIYFLLVGGAVSRWHRVASDETWHFHEGGALDLFVADPEWNGVSVWRLGPWGSETEPVRIVPADAWQAARCAAGYTLVSCTVGPGFEFADFEMLRDRATDVRRLTTAHPHLASLV